MLPTLKYTVMRLALFVVAIGVLTLLGVRGLPAIALAVVISAMLSYLLLRRQRDVVAGQVSAGLRRRMGTNRGAGADEQIEDAVSEQGETKA